MKKLLIAFSMIGAGALVACAEGAGSQSNSVTTNYASQAWFSASASESTIVRDGGDFSVKTGSASTYKANGNKIEFDGDDVSDPVSFKLATDTSIKTTALTRIEFELDATVVPFGALPKKDEIGDAKVAFALGKNGSTNFYAWVGGNVWTSLDFSNIPAENESYTLTMCFDDTVEGAEKVQFIVGSGSPVVSESSAWLAYGGMSEKPQIDFVGTGKLTSMTAHQVAIVSAEINFDGGKVTIAEKDAVAMGKLVTGDADADTIEKVLAKPVKDTVTGGAITIDSSCPLTTAEAYAIGLIAKGQGDTMVAKDDGTFQVKADATASVEGGIKIGFVNSMTPNDTTATITYGLKGSKNGSDWSDPFAGVSATYPANIVIPTAKVTEGYRFFKVVTTVTLKDAPQN